jgi:hypothetical protein
LANQQLNFFLPLKVVDNQESLALRFASSQYAFHKEHLYLLGSICITDKTFGELSINLDRIEQIPRSLQIREVQWRIRVVTYKWMVLADSGTNMNLIGDENGLVKKYVSPRIESDDYSQTKDYEVDEELNLHL